MKMRSSALALSRAVGGGGGGGSLPIMDYIGRLRPKGVLFSGWGYMKG